MAEFNRKSLREIFEAADIDVPKDVLGQICELHTTSQEGLTEALKTAQTNLEKTEQERDAYKAKAPKEGQETVAKEEYDKIVKEFGDYKAEQTAKETRRAKEHAIRELYKAVGISEKRIDAVVKVTDVDAIELDADGNITDAEARTEAAKTEWADFIPTKWTKGVETATPPQNTGGSTKTKAEIMAMTDPVERQAEIAKNPTLFGI